MSENRPTSDPDQPNPARDANAEQPASLDTQLGITRAELDDAIADGRLLRLTDADDPSIFFLFDPAMLVGSMERRLRLQRHVMRFLDDASSDLAGAAQPRASTERQAQRRFPTTFSAYHTSDGTHIAERSG